jgi:hypothetical protein
MWGRIDFQLPNDRFLQSVQTGRFHTGLASISIARLAT